MGNVYKVVVTGPFNVGKTEFVRTISDIPIVSTERRITDDLVSTKKETTVAMDYGHVKVDDDMFHLHGTPGQPRFDFMWEILSKEMHAYLLLVDSSRLESLFDAKKLLRTFGRKGNAPCMIVANKQDMESVLSTEEIRKRLGLDEETLIVPCVATEKEKVRDVMKKLQVLVHNWEYEK
ncbi:MAG: GTP-binding protein [Chloroflexi bacterium]|nr:GTP-binding protein [Chloroflexota bacterium]